jgi:hypothetical protein
MSNHRHRRITRDAAEQLLDSAAIGTSAGGDALTDLLAVAAAPMTRSGELPGERAAIAARSSARLSPVPHARRRSMIKTTLAKILTVKIAAIGALAAASGVAVAATTGLVSNPLSTGSQGPNAHASAHATNSGHPSPGASRPKSQGSPSPSLVGLCQAFTAGAGTDHGKALDNPAFTVLITTAGGKDHVADYCAGLLATAPAAKPKASASPHPNASAHPTGSPKPHSTDHPTGKPSESSH